MVLEEFQSGSDRTIEEDINMLNVSPEFKSAAESSSRSVKAAAIFHFLGKLDLPFATATASSIYDSSIDPNQACNGRINATAHTCSGYLPPIFAGTQKGWWGQYMANNQGILSTPEVLTVMYNQPLTGKNFWILGIPGFFPVDFKVERLIDTTWHVIADVVGNTSYQWISTSSVPAVTLGARLTITKIAPVGGSVRILQFGLVSTVMFEGNDITDISLLEEVASDAVSPIGTVSSNELNVALSNTHRWYNARNTQSPFYGLLQTKIIVQSYIGIDIGTEIFEYVPLGQFATGDWAVPSTTADATVTAYDILYQLLSLPVPQIPLAINTTIGSLFTSMFISLGITAYDVDPTLTQPVPYGWIPFGTIGDALNELSLAGSCHVFMSRQNRIQVKSCFNTSSSPVTTIVESQIMEIDNPQKLVNLYSSIVVNCAIPNVGDEMIIARLDNISIPPGSTTFTNVAFQEGPVVAISQIALVGTKMVRIVDFTWSPWSVTIELFNSAYLENISIVFYGSIIGHTAIPFTRSTEGSAGGRTLPISTNLIQDPTTAEQYATNMLQYASDPLAQLGHQTTGNPAVELLDIVTLQDAYDKLENLNVSVLSQKLNFDGGLSIDTITKVISA